MSIEKMLSHVYEIEGLMLVSRRLGEENTPDVITNKLHRKVRELAEMCGVELSPQQPAPAPQEPVQEPIQEPHEEPEVQAEHLPEDDYDADETWQHDNGEEFNEVFKLNYQEPAHQAQDDNQVPVADREPDEDITVEFIEAPDDEPDAPAQDQDTPAQDQDTPAQDQDTPAQEQDTPAQDQDTPAQEQPAAVATPVPPVFRAPEEVNEEPVPEPDPDILPEAEDEPDITVEFIEADDTTVPEPEYEMPVPPVPTEFPEPEEAPSPLRVDEKLQRTLSKDIRKAFSLNDRFRFQRELFAGSADALNTAIAHIEAMRSYGNAELYFFSQLNWDRENEVVKDFMAIVRNHFQK